MTMRRQVLSHRARFGWLLLHLWLGLGLVWPPGLRAQGPEGLPEPPPLYDQRFGAVEAYDAPEVARAAGVGWTRVIFWWHQLQPSGPQDWNPYFFPDGLLNQERDAGRQMVGILLGTPGWASPTGSPRAVPDGLYLPYDDPGNLWGQFTYRMAQRYRGQIDHWIIWNEPDVWQEGHPGRTWEGSVEDYVQLLRVAYQAIRAANADAMVHLTATTYWWDAQYGREQYLKRLLDAIVAHPDAATHNHFFDVASLHIYFTPQQVWDVTRYFRGELVAHGLGAKPLWINEMNAPPSEDPAHPAPTARFRVTLEQQANFLLQGWAMGLAAGAERISLYKTRDEPSLPSGIEPYGMRRRDGSLRPLFWSYRTLVTYLGHYTHASLVNDGPVRRVQVERGALGRTTVVWNMATTPREVVVPASADEALLVDEYGPLGMIQPQDGGYRLALPASDGRIGGKSYLVVEGAGVHVHIPRPDIGPAPTLATATVEATIEATATLTPTPPITGTTPTLSPPPLGEATLTPTATPTVSATLAPTLSPSVTATLLVSATLAPTSPPLTMASTSSPTSTLGLTPTLSATATPSPTVTPSPTATPSTTTSPSASATATPTATATWTATPSTTATRTHTPTTTPSPSATGTPRASPTRSASATPPGREMTPGALGAPLTPTRSASPTPPLDERAAERTPPPALSDPPRTAQAGLVSLSWGDTLLRMVIVAGSVSFFWAYARRFQP